MNALDVSLNNDIHNDVHQHVSMAQHLPDNDPRKFSMMMQKKGSHAYLHLWDPALRDTNVEHGVPSLTRIIEDVICIHNETYMRIYMACGVALEGRMGRRKKKGVGPGCRGKQERSTTVSKRRWIHPDVSAYKKEMQYSQLQLQSQSLTIHCKSAI
eukprot:2513657-Ditylum_brightwellii.AAC.1